MINPGSPKGDPKVGVLHELARQLLQGTGVLLPPSDAPAVHPPIGSFYTIAAPSRVGAALTTECEHQLLLWAALGPPPKNRFELDWQQRKREKLARPWQVRGLAQQGLGPAISGRINDATHHNVLSESARTCRCAYIYIERERCTNCPTYTYTYLDVAYVHMQLLKVKYGP